MSAFLPKIGALLSAATLYNHRFWRGQSRRWTMIRRNCLVTSQRIVRYHS